MATIFEFRNYAFRIYTNDHAPAHVHIVGPDGWAIVELATWRVIRAKGLRESQLKELVAVACDEHRQLLAAWRSIHEG